MRKSLGRYLVKEWKMWRKARIKWLSLPCLDNDLKEMSEIRNPQLWESGELKIEWVRHHMPLLEGLEKEFKETKPFKGLKVALSVHLEAKTAHLCEVLAEGGAEMYVTGSNPLSTQDDVAAFSLGTMLPMKSITVTHRALSRQVRTSSSMMGEIL